MDTNLIAAWKRLCRTARRSADVYSKTFPNLAQRLRSEVAAFCGQPAPHNDLELTMRREARAVMSKSWGVAALQSKRADAEVLASIATVRTKWAGRVGHGSKARGKL